MSNLIDRFLNTEEDCYGVKYLKELKLNAEVVKFIRRREILSNLRERRINSKKNRSLLKIMRK